MNDELVFISRHDPNDGQVALAKSLGYSSIKKMDVIFTDDPMEDLLNAGISEKKIAIVAPSYVSNKLLNEGYELIEFVNAPSKRVKNLFCCQGAYIYKLPEITERLDKAIPYYRYGACVLSRSHIDMNFISCPIPIEEQEESKLH